MKTANLRVGVKGIPAVTVPVQTADLDDVQTLSKGSLDVLIRCFNRGFRIESQERSGARDKVRDAGLKESATEHEKAALTKEVGAIVASYDPSIVHPRTTGPRKPVEIKLAKGKKAYTPDELAALLAAHGVKATLVTPE